MGELNQRAWFIPAIQWRSTKKCYGYNMMPMRDKKQWEKMNVIDVHPPLYTKVMGMPKKNRKKDPKEKKDKNGLKKVTKRGVTMHCSICGATDHNKKGHHNHANENPNVEVTRDSQEEYDDPSIIDNIMPHMVYPQLDPTQTPDSMVYKMQEREKFAYPPPREFGPLLESIFITTAREAILVGRVTTTMARDRVTSQKTEDAADSSQQAAASTRPRKNQARGGSTSTNFARQGSSVEEQELLLEEEELLLEEEDMMLLEEQDLLLLAFTISCLEMMEKLQDHTTCMLNRRF